MSLKYIIKFILLPFVIWLVLRWFSQTEFWIARRKRPVNYSDSLWQRPYVYEALETPNSIRVLMLWPGEENDAIDCDFHQWSLDSVVMHGVEALSYTWGDVNKRQRIRCSGGTLEITESLYRALLHLRYRWVPRLLWVDAVCINQEDLIERSKQVRMMGEIYAKARRVLIWLGEDNELSENAFRSVKEVNNFFPPMKKLIGYYGDPKRLHQVTRQSLIRDGMFDYLLGRRSFMEYDLEPLIELLNRPWFQRKWVVQEYVKGKRAIGICGKNTISWNNIILLAFYLALGDAAHLSPLFMSYRGRKAAQALEQIRSMALIRELKEDTKRSLLNVLLLTRKFQVTKPVDSIFAVMGLTTDVTPSDSEILPNYELDEEQMFKRIAKWGIVKRRSLGYLSSISKAPDTESQLSLPSWVANFSKLESCYPLLGEDAAIFKAGGSSDPKPRLSEEENMLHLAGKIIDTVKAIGDVGMAESLPPDDLPNLEKAQLMNQSMGLWVKQCQEIAFDKASTIPEDRYEDRYEEFWRTMVCDMTGQGARAPPELGRAFRGFMKVVETGFEKDTHDIESLYKLLEDSQQIQPAITNHFATRRFCVTENDRMGQMPKAAEVGDRICVFQGASVPYVIRSATDGDYALIGDCYLHGVMDGEAFREGQTGCEEIALR